MALIEQTYTVYRGGKVIRTPAYQDETVTLYHGDCVEVLAGMEENSIDSFVTDPPYHLTQVSRKGSPRQNNPETPFGRTRLGSKGFMGKTWDGGDIAFRPETWAAVLHVCKPGAYAAIFGGTRTVHRLACAVEDAGFELTEQIDWITGSGFPHGVDVSKALDGIAGVERRAVSSGAAVKRMIPGADQVRTGSWIKDNGLEHVPVITEAATAIAKCWEGFNTSIKPAHEPIVLAQKPLDTVTCAEIYLLTGWDFYCTKRTVERTKEYRVELHTFKAMHGAVRSYTELRKYLKGEKTHTVLKTEDAGEFKAFSVCNVAANVLKWGVGALNIDACRVGSSGWTKKDGEASGSNNGHIGQIKNREAGVVRSSDQGRWPSNIILSHSVLCQRVGERIHAGDKRPGRNGSRSGGFLNVGSDTENNGGPNGPMYGNETVPVYECVEGCPIRELDIQSGVTTSGDAPAKRSAAKFKNTFGEFAGQEECPPGREGNEGTASRFFYQADWSEQDLVPFIYQAKASRGDRDKGLEDAEYKVMKRVNPGGLEHDPKWGPIQVKNNHATVKPIALIRYLQRLITPPGGITCDPFAGSGTSGVAAPLEGFKCVLIEQDPEYSKLITERLRGSIPPLFRETIGKEPR